MGDLAFSIIGESISGSLQQGSWHFPTRNDYIDYLLGTNLVSDPNDIWQNDRFTVAIQRHWHSRGQNGCVFAQVAANGAGQNGWHSIVIKGEIQDVVSPENQRNIGSNIALAIHDPDCQIISFLFPQVVDPGDLVTLLRSLTNTPNIILRDATKHDDMITFALRVAITNAPKIVLSWLMGFGPFTFFPTTRQAPVTELAIRTKVKPDKIYERLNQDREAAHLADMPLELAEQAWPRIWNATLNRTRVILGGEPNFFSAARTTFSVPWKLWVNGDHEQLSEHPAHLI